MPRRRMPIGEMVYHYGNGKDQIGVIIERIDNLYVNVFLIREQKFVCVLEGFLNTFRGHKKTYVE